MTLRVVAMLCNAILVVLCTAIMALLCIVCVVAVLCTVRMVCVVCMGCMICAGAQVFFIDLDVGVAILVSDTAVLETPGDVRGVVASFSPSPEAMP